MPRFRNPPKFSGDGCSHCGHQTLRCAALRGLCSLKAASEIRSSGPLRRHAFCALRTNTYSRESRASHSNGAPQVRRMWRNSANFMLLAEKGKVQRLPWGSRSDCLLEAHKRAKKGARSRIEVRCSKGQTSMTRLRDFAK